MKKLITLIVCLLTFIGAYAIEPSLVFYLPDESVAESGAGITADGQYVCVKVEQKGNDAYYTIYKPGFIVDKSFTIKDAYTLDEYNDESGSYPGSLECLNFGTRDWDVYAIQGLGTDESKWFVFIHSFSQDENRLKIYDDTGNLICDNFQDTAPYYYIDADHKTYIVTNIGIDGIDDAYYGFWDFRGTSGVNAPIAVSRTSRAYPNPLHQGRQFTIELSETAPDGTCVIVSDMNGATVYTAEVQPGADKVVIPSRKLRHGNLVYSVMAGENILEKGKIIVR